jgi:peptide/nickel transport system permease protein
MGMLRYAASRLLQAVGLVLAVVVLNFVLVHAAPGDPVETIAGASGGHVARADGAAAQAVRARPVLAGAAGRVPGQGGARRPGLLVLLQPAGDGHVAERVPATLLLVLSAVLLAFFVGTALGVLSARKPNGWLSQFITVLSLVGFAAPVFWLGIMLVILLASVFPILPVAGMRAIDSSAQAGWPTCSTWRSTWCCPRSR